MTTASDFQPIFFALSTKVNKNSKMLLMLMISVQLVNFSGITLVYVGYQKVSLCNVVRGLNGRHMQPNHLLFCIIITNFASLTTNKQNTMNTSLQSV